MPARMRLTDAAGTSALTFDCGRLPAEAAVAACGHEPDGYFWEGVVRYLAGGLAAQLDLAPQAGMFCARGDRALLLQLCDQLEEYLEHPELTARLIKTAEAAGFRFGG